MNTNPYRYSELAGAYVIASGKKTRWIVFRKGSKKRYLESAYTDNSGKTWHVIQIGKTKGERLKPGGFVYINEHLYVLTSRACYISKDDGKSYKLHDCERMWGDKL